MAQSDKRCFSFASVFLLYLYILIGIISNFHLQNLTSENPQSPADAGGAADLLDVPEECTVAAAEGPHALSVRVKGHAALLREAEVAPRRDGVLVCREKAKVPPALLRLVLDALPNVVAGEFARDVLKSIGQDREHHAVRTLGLGQR